MKAALVFVLTFALTAWAHGALLALVALARERGLELGLLAARHEEGVLLGVLDYLLGHNLSLEATQSALD